MQIQFIITHHNNKYVIKEGFLSYHRFAGFASLFRKLVDVINFYQKPKKVDKSIIDLMNQENPVSIWKLPVKTIRQLKRLNLSTYYEANFIDQYEVGSDVPLLIVTYSTSHRRHKRRARRHVNDVLDHACPLTEKWGTNF